jgi:hypothetical protein
MNGSLRHLRTPLGIGLAVLGLLVLAAYPWPKPVPEPVPEPEPTPAPEQRETAPNPAQGQLSAQQKQMLDAVKRSKGNYDRLSVSEKESLERMSQGHGKNLYELIRKRAATMDSGATAGKKTL